MDGKPIWRSKTFWFNVIALVVFVATRFGYADFTPDPDLMAAAAAILNIVLRLVTREPVRLR